MFTFNEFGNSLWLLINQAGVAVDGGDSGEIWPWKQTKGKKTTKHLTIKHKPQVNLSVDEMFAVEEPTLNEMRLFHRGDSASTFRAAAEKKIESHLMA